MVSGFRVLVVLSWLFDSLRFGPFGISGSRFFGGRNSGFSRPGLRCFDWCFWGFGLIFFFGGLGFGG